MPDEHRCVGAHVLPPYPSAAVEVTVRSTLQPKAEEPGTSPGVVGLRTVLSVGDPTSSRRTPRAPRNLDCFPGTVVAVTFHCAEGHSIRLNSGRDAAPEGYPVLRDGSAAWWRERFMHWGFQSFSYQLLGGRQTSVSGKIRQLKV